MKKGGKECIDGRVSGSSMVTFSVVDDGRMSIGASHDDGRN